MSHAIPPIREPESVAAGLAPPLCAAARPALVVAQLAAPAVRKMLTTTSCSSRAPKLSSRTPKLSFRAQRALCFFFLTALVLSLAIQAQAPQRPRIFGIASVAILVADLENSGAFYAKILGKDQPCLWCGQPRSSAYSVNPVQFVDLRQPSESLPANLIDEITFATDDLPALRKYLAAQSIPTTPGGGLDDNPAPPEKARDRARRPNKTVEPGARLSVLDPEGHHITFVQLPADVLQEFSQHQKERLIHAGFIVRDRAATEHFYKDILGFRPYWHGGMKEDQTDWVSMQVPDGTDWLEFMVNVSADPDQRVRGIMDHIAIGVADIEAARFAAQKNGTPITEQPKIGRDGKWQLNLYDPDQTRVEFMEFKPVQKPCCSDFTGPHPQP
jgi:catechol 2,3-dioxygenase-like lactoylglutathione lyase family enzyme